MVCDIMERSLRGAVTLCRLLDAHGLARVRSPAQARKVSRCLEVSSRSRRARKSRQAALRGIAVNQDGMSSTMTAPNGPSQTMVVATALLEAKMSHHEAGAVPGRYLVGTWSVPGRCLLCLLIPAFAFPTPGAAHGVPWYGHPVG